MSNIEYGQDSAGIEELLSSVERPGNYCALGRLFAAMPVVSVDGVGDLSLPVREGQVRALMSVAERAPYGRGPDTVVDTSVRDCWQIDAGKFRLGGSAWPATFAQILETIAHGLGCPEDRIEARLYKLLVYDEGGFFCGHRDTEKAPGMIATLCISLPTSGSGGDLIVRHGGRETTIEMQAEEPSELAFAAFYADCTHETRRVASGHRLSVVYNLCLQPGDTRTPRTAPDYSDVAEWIAHRLAERGSAKGSTGSDAPAIVWLLEHEYSPAGLSFDTLKNGDDAVARTLGRAADRADWALQAAIVHIEEEGTAEFHGEPIGYWEGPTDHVRDMKIGEIFRGARWLADWVGRDGEALSFGKIPLDVAELLPTGALDDAEPDEQRLHEASGNEGVSLERAYRRAALVMWPRAAALDVIARGSAAAAVAWVEDHLDGDAAPAGMGSEELLSRLVDLWTSSDSLDHSDARGAMLRLLAAAGRAVPAVRFLREVLLMDYDGSENADLPPVLELAGPPDAAEFLTTLAPSALPSYPEETIALLRSACTRLLNTQAPLWQSALRKSASALLDALPAAFANQDGDDKAVWPPARRVSLNASATAELFLLAQQCGLTQEAETAAAIVVGHPRAVTPGRTLPAALAEMRTHAGMTGSKPYLILWGRAADALLERSATPPKPPQDWAIAANLSCGCELCERLRTFCEDPTARVARYPLRKDLRKHLHREIDQGRLDLFHQTERRGSPFTLVCTKNRASHERRLVEYSEDVACMRSLIESVPDGASATEAEAALESLRGACAAS
ncbi:MAG: 2OG-Fe(II) oxygenase [Gammaproteobacteria bacterium]|nr:2OG-Fe(II) oxygenase [Gammaproteobacteria bacterium]